MITFYFLGTWSAQICYFAKNLILISFQACTGIENFEECLAHLEQNDWNLTGAINSVFGAQGDTAQDESGTRHVSFQEPSSEPIGYVGGSMVVVVGPRGGIVGQDLMQVH